MLTFMDLVESFVGEDFVAVALLLCRHRLVKAQAERETLKFRKHGIVN
jgi:hypothetical protein